MIYNEYLLTVRVIVRHPMLEHVSQEGGVAEHSDDIFFAVLQFPEESSAARDHVLDALPILRVVALIETRVDFRKVEARKLPHSLAHRLPRVVDVLPGALATPLDHNHWNRRQAAHRQRARRCLARTLQR